MGGHGGLNILPQKRWNVYNYENREKVRRDEEAAAREEQLKREQARKRDAEFRLERLRASRGLAPLEKAPEPAEHPATEPVESEPKSGGHINLFEGIKIFDPIQGLENEKGGEKDGFKRKKMKKEEAAPKVVGPEEEKYRLGYGVAGKGVKLPWYMERRTDDKEEENGKDDGSSRGAKKEVKNSGKKTIQELREERLKREKQEKERERALLLEKSRRESQRNGTFSVPLMKNSGFSRR
ncbi:hypothetical protein SLEP1_g8889 [Rubroshorea leprosula]|uniref:CBF1-interacting co-repressor CIR N-terminal domain-containing protein n=1 Tax=Rubroshorea leprosula TaxID=152421 RepID=A0AAV5I345_9ROSI|nr:hypothetical protein SLEP1_g8889 [Rubroshorea leprosula]